MKNSVLKAFDPGIARLIIGGAILCAMEMLIVVGVIAFYVPYRTDPALMEIFFHYRKGFMPERELPLYALGIMMAAGFLVGLIYFFRERFAVERFRKSLTRYVIIHAVMVIAQISIVFMLIITPANAMAWTLLYGMFGISALIKIFYSEIDAWFGRTS